MSAANKIVCTAMALMAAVSLAGAEDLGFTVGLNAAFGDVLSQAAVEVTPSIEWSGSLSVLDLTLHAEYTKSFAAGAGAGSSTVSEEVSFTLGEDTSLTATLNNENTFSFEGEAVTGKVEPSAAVAIGIFSASAGLPIDYAPATSVALWATLGLAGQSWTAELTGDFGLSGGFSFEDVVLYGDVSFSVLTPSLSVTLPGSFDSVTLSPALDVTVGDFTFGAAADLDLSASGTTLSPSLSASFSF